MTTDAHQRRQIVALWSDYCRVRDALPRERWTDEHRARVHTARQRFDAQVKALKRSDER